MIGEHVTPLDTKDLAFTNMYRVALMKRPEYKNISIGDYNGKVSLSPGISSTTALNFFNDLVAAEELNKEVQSFISRKEITQEVRKGVDEIVKKWEKRIGKKFNI